MDSHRSNEGVEQDQALLIRALTRVAIVLTLITGAVYIGPAVAGESPDHSVQQSH